MTFDYQGKELPILHRPDPDGTTRQLALLEPVRKQSTFIDPANPDAAPIVWQGSWRTLEPVWQLAPHWENFAKVWNLIDYPRLLFNTVVIAVISTIGTLLSCTLVAYGFARFKFPGRNLLFTLLHRDDLPAGGRDDHPDVHDLPEARLGRDVAAAARAGLLRQRLRRVPDAPVLPDDPDATSTRPPRSTAPARSARSSRSSLPQAWPVVIAVAIFHLVYSWNDFFGPLIYLLGKPDLQTSRSGCSGSTASTTETRALIQAGTLMTLVIPVIASCSPSASSPAGSSSPASRSERPMPFRVALTFDAEHPDRPASRRRARNGVLDALAATGVRGDVLRPGPLGRGVSRRSRGRSPTAATSSATTRTTMPGCRC